MSPTLSSHCAPSVLREDVVDLLRSIISTSSTFRSSRSHMIDPFLNHVGTRPRCYESYSAAYCVWYLYLYSKSNWAIQAGPLNCRIIRLIVFPVNFYFICWTPVLRDCTKIQGCCVDNLQDGCYFSSVAASFSTLIDNLSGPFVLLGFN